MNGSVRLSGIAIGDAFFQAVQQTLRELLTQTAKVVLALALLLMWNGQQAYADEVGPNIVLFVVDDMGWQDTSVPFSKEPTALNRRYRTPNMERLAAQGMKFTHARAHAVCSPTRVAIMTGQNPARSRVTNWTKDRDQIPSRGDNRSLLAPRDWNYNSLQPLGTGIPHSIEAPTLASLLQQAGYMTIHVGKAHWGTQGTPGESPTNLGFDANVAGWSGGAPGNYRGIDNFGNKNGEHSEPWGVPGLESYHGSDIFLTEVLTREAIKLMDHAIVQHQPFFLHLSHYAVHTPLSMDTRFAANYTELTGDELRYATMIEGMDRSLGDLMSHLEVRGVADSTILLFISDNGGLDVPSLAGNGPLRSGKGSGYEGGLRVPMLIRSPGVAPPGSICAINVVAEDLFPTVLAMAGADVPDNYVVKLDGRSICPLISASDDFESDRPLFFHQPHQHAGSPYSAVVQGHWKLLYWHQTESFSLFNLEADLGEKNDLANALPDRVDQLAELLHDYLVEVNAQMPTYRDSGRKVAMPSRQGVQIGLGDASAGAK